MNQQQARKLALNRAAAIIANLDGGHISCHYDLSIEDEDRLYSAFQDIAQMLQRKSQRINVAVNTQHDISQTSV